MIEALSYRCYSARARNTHVAAELTLRPVLTEIGATVPGRGLFVIDRDHEYAACADWLALTGPIVAAFPRSREEGIRDHVAHQPGP